MQFSEVFLRLGSGLVAWMVLYAHILWLAVLGQLDCAVDGDEFHRLLLGLVPLSAIAIALLAVTRPLDGVHGTLRWLGVPLALMTPFALVTIWRSAKLTLFAGGGFCGESSAVFWEQAWPLLQLLIVAGVTLRIVQHWRGRAMSPG